VNRRLALCMMAIAALVTTSRARAASHRATLEEAKALVRKAREYIRSNGRAKAFAEIDRRDGMFVDRDLYIYVYDASLRNLAHGGNPRLVGKNLAEMRDPDGKRVDQGLLEAARKGGGTFTFKFLNPARNRIETKTGYAEMEGDLIVGSGVYIAIA